MSCYSIITSCNRCRPTGLFTTDTVEDQMVRLGDWIEQHTGKSFGAKKFIEIPEGGVEEISSGCMFEEEEPIRYIKLEGNIAKKILQSFGDLFLCCDMCDVYIWIFTSEEKHPALFEKATSITMF
jgi:hypothetical protein